MTDLRNIWAVVGRGGSVHYLRLGDLIELNRIAWARGEMLDGPLFFSPHEGGARAQMVQAKRMRADTRERGGRPLEDDSGTAQPAPCMETRIGTDERKRLAL